MTDLAAGNFEGVGLTEVALADNFSSKLSHGFSSPSKDAIHCKWLISKEMHESHSSLVEPFAMRNLSPIYLSNIWWPGITKKGESTWIR